MYNRFVTSDIIAELGRGVLSAHDLRERLGVSPSTLMRLVREAGPKILRIGRGRATQYGLRQTWPNLEGPRFPLFRISESGAAVSAGELITLTAHQTAWMRSEEHTSELQSHLNLVCRLLLEKKKKTKIKKTAK